MDPRTAEAILPRVYGAALAVAADPETAADATATGMAAGSPLAAAVRSAAATDPAAAFAVLPPREREVLALARVAGLSVPQIADELGIGPDAVKARMRAGLRALSAAQVRV